MSHTILSSVLVLLLTCGVALSYEPPGQSHRKITGPPPGIQRPVYNPRPQPIRQLTPPMRPPHPVPPPRPLPPPMPWHGLYPPPPLYRPPVIPVWVQTRYIPQQTYVEVPVPSTYEAPKLDYNEWMPVGSFYVQTSDREDSRVGVVQMVLHNSGYVRGAFYSYATKGYQEISGMVDPQSNVLTFSVTGDLSPYSVRMDSLLTGNRVEYQVLDRKKTMVLQRLQ